MRAAKIPPPRSRWSPWAIALALCAVSVAPCRAEAQSAADRETARSLIVTGREKLEAGDAAGAFKDFDAAHAIMHVPTTGLDKAKALLALGRLVEARDVALEVTRTVPQPRESPAFPKARVAAAELAEALATRIATVVIVVNGPPPDAAEVALDGIKIPAPALGLPRKTDPGPHQLTARAEGFAEVERSFTLPEGGTDTIEITLGPFSDAPRKVEPPPKPKPVATGVPAWAWASGGLGIAAGAVAVAFAFDYASAQGTIATDCPGGTCDPTRYTQDDVDALEARRMRSFSLAVGLGAAGALGVGIFVIGIAGSGAPAAGSLQRRGSESGAALDLSVTPRGVRLGGTF